MTSSNIFEWKRLFSSSAFDGASSLTTRLDRSIYLTGYKGTVGFISKYNSDEIQEWKTANTCNVIAPHVGIDVSIYITGYVSSNLNSQQLSIML